MKPFIVAYDCSTLATLIVPAFYNSNLEKFKTRQVSTRLNKYGIVSHTIILYFVSGMFIHLPIGLVIRYCFFAEFLRTSISQYFWYMIGAYFAGAILHTVFVILYFKVND